MTVCDWLKIPSSEKSHPFILLRHGSGAEWLHAMDGRRAQFDQAAGSAVGRAQGRRWESTSSLVRQRTAEGEDQGLRTADR